MSAQPAIHLLPPDVAAKIAAGEVVERPANVVKELIENSLDAGATDVRVEIREGGRRLLRVADNGHGMRAEEAPLAFLRHSTSKLRTADDLSAIATFGFRGEALYSIAAVSHSTLLTRHRDEESGVLLHFEGGELRSQGRAGAPVGTVVTVEFLFFNVPARLKFLRAPQTEAGQVAAVVQRYALAYPACRFTYLSDDRLVFQTTGSGELFDVLVQVYGLEAARQMVPLRDAGTETTPEANLEEDVEFLAPLDRREEQEQPVHVTGYAGLPTLTRANRTGIQLFVNRRAVEDRSLTHAVVQAYHTLLPVGRFPVAVVLVELDPAAVDVNVHPQKLQVRFFQERRVFHAVQKAVRRAVVDRLGVPGLGIEAASPDTPAPTWAGTTWSSWESEDWSARRDALIQAGPQRAFDLPPARAATGAGDAGALAPDSMEAGPAAARVLPPLRVVGQVGATYIVAEGPQGMFLIDQHAAHERILYEQFMEQRWGLVGGEVARQHLLTPVTLHAGGTEAGLVAHHLAELAHVGFEIEPFGGDSFLLRAVPSLLAGEDPVAALLDIATSLSGGRNLAGEEFEAQLVKMVCKRAAIKAGQLLSDIEMQELVRQLEECRSPRTCPHGRPTMIQLSAGELEKAFGRI